MGNVYAALVQCVGSVHAVCRQHAGSMQSTPFHMAQDPSFYPTSGVNWQLAPCKKFRITADLSEQNHI